MPTEMVRASRQGVVVDVIHAPKGPKQNDDKQRMQDVLHCPGRRLAVATELPN